MEEEPAHRSHHQTPSCPSQSYSQSHRTRLSLQLLGTERASTPCHAIDLASDEATAKVCAHLCRSFSHHSACSHSYHLEPTRENQIMLYHANTAYTDKSETHRHCGNIDSSKNIGWHGCKRRQECGYHYPLRPWRQKSRRTQNGNHGD